jgi:hypothetical protein
VNAAVREAPGIKRPVAQAPPAAVPGLTAEVSNAGAPAMVTLAWSDDAGAVAAQTAALAARPPGGKFIHRRSPPSC